MASCCCKHEQGPERILNCVLALRYGWIRGFTAMNPRSSDDLLHQSVFIYAVQEGRHIAAGYVKVGAERLGAVFFLPTLRDS